MINGIKNTIKIPYYKDNLIGEIKNGWKITKEKSKNDDG